MKTVNLKAVAFEKATSAELQIAARTEGADEFKRLTKIIDKDFPSRDDRTALIEYLKSLGFNSIQIDSDIRVHNPDMLIPFEVARAMHRFPVTPTTEWLESLGFIDISLQLSADDHQVYAVSRDSLMVRDLKKLSPKGNFRVGYKVKAGRKTLGDMYLHIRLHSEALVTLMAKDFDHNL